MGMLLRRYHQPVDVPADKTVETTAEPVDVPTDEPTPQKKGRGKKNEGTNN